MQCAIERSDYSAAEVALKNMAKTSRSASLTRFLAYKLAIRNHDQELGEPLVSLLKLELMHGISVRMSRRPQSWQK